MAIGKAIGGYLLVGLLFVPFVYWNSANGYRTDGAGRNVGQALSGGGCSSGPLTCFPSNLR